MKAYDFLKGSELENFVKSAEDYSGSYGQTGPQSYEDAVIELAKQFISANYPFIEEYFDINYDIPDEFLKNKDNKVLVHLSLIGKNSNNNDLEAVLVFADGEFLPLVGIYSQSLHQWFPATKEWIEKLSTTIDTSVDYATDVEKRFSDPTNVQISGDKTTEAGNFANYNNTIKYSKLVEELTVFMMSLPSNDIKYLIKKAGTNIDALSNLISIYNAKQKIKEIKKKANLTITKKANSREDIIEEFKRELDKYKGHLIKLVDGNIKILGEDDKLIATVSVDNDIKSDIELLDESEIIAKIVSYYSKFIRIPKVMISPLDDVGILLIPSFFGRIHDRKIINEKTEDDQLIVRHVADTIHDSSKYDLNKSLYSNVNYYIYSTYDKKVINKIINDYIDPNYTELTLQDFKKNVYDPMKKETMTLDDYKNINDFLHGLEHGLFIINGKLTSVENTFYHELLMIRDHIDSIIQKSEEIYKSTLDDKYIEKIKFPFVIKMISSGELTAFELKESPGSTLFKFVFDTNSGILRKLYIYVSDIGASRYNTNIVIKFGTQNKFYILNKNIYEDLIETPDLTVVPLTYNNSVIYMFLATPAFSPYVYGYPVKEVIRKIVIGKEMARRIKEGWFEPKLKVITPYTAQDLLISPQLHVEKDTSGYKISLITKDSGDVMKVSNLNYLKIACGYLGLGEKTVNKLIKEVNTKKAASVDLVNTPVNDDTIIKLLSDKLDLLFSNIKDKIDMLEKNISSIEDIVKDIAKEHVEVAKKVDEVSNNIEKATQAQEQGNQQAQSEASQDNTNATASQAPAEAQNTQGATIDPETAKSIAMALMDDNYAQQIGLDEQTYQLLMNALNGDQNAMQQLGFTQADIDMIIQAGKQLMQEQQGGASSQAGAAEAASQPTTGQQSVAESSAPMEGQPSPQPEAEQTQNNLTPELQQKIDTLIQALFDQNIANQVNQNDLQDIITIIQNPDQAIQAGIPKDVVSYILQTYDYYKNMYVGQQATNMGAGMPVDSYTQQMETLPEQLPEEQRDILNQAASILDLLPKYKSMKVFYKYSDLFKKLLNALGELLFSFEILSAKYKKELGEKTYEDLIWKTKELYDNIGTFMLTMYNIK